MSTRTETRRVAVGDVAIESTEDGVVLIVGGVRFDAERTKVIGDLLLRQRLGETAMPGWNDSQVIGSEPVWDEHAEIVAAASLTPAREINPGDYLMVPQSEDHDNDGFFHAGEWWTCRSARSFAGRTRLGFGDGELRFDVIVDDDTPIKVSDASRLAPVPQ